MLVKKKQKLFPQLGHFKFCINDKQFTTWLCYILLCYASSNSNESHKQTFELVISFLWQ